MVAGGGAPLNRRTRARGSERSTAPDGASLYKRLPRGPHRLGREAVRSDQRGRIQGALVEAVARSGYHEASVKQVIALAGVSRRSFYEQFANKHECFLASFDRIAGRELQRLRRAHADADGDWQRRLAAACHTCATDALHERKAALLVLSDAQAAGTAGTLRLRRAMADCEELLGTSLQRCSQAPRLPAPIVRAIVGGLHGTLTSELRAEQPSSAAALAERMLGWTVALAAPGASPLAPVLHTRLRREMRAIALGRPRGGARAPSDDRVRLLESVLRLTALHPFGDVTAPQVAEEAGLAIDAFFEHFDDRDRCLLAALDMVAQDLLEIASDPALASAQWEHAVRHVVAELLAHLADRPLHARTLIHHGGRLGGATLAWSTDVSRQLVELLTRGAPATLSPLACEALAGALWHTIRCQVAGGRVQLLRALADHVSYVVLAPCIGADAATAVLLDG